jgi:hypothetical protein
VPGADAEAASRLELPDLNTLDEKLNQIDADLDEIDHGYRLWLLAYNKLPEEMQQSRKWQKIKLHVDSALKELKEKYPTPKPMRKTENQ